MIERKTTISRLDRPYYGHEYNVQVWTSLDGGETWWYAGIGKYARTEDEAQQIVQEYRKQNVLHGLNGDEEIVWR